MRLTINFVVTACVALANIVKSSLGPEGLDKMLVDQIGDVTITNDGATILKKLEVEHPAARVLVELAQHQDEEVGDGTTSVVILAAELLKVRLLCLRSALLSLENRLTCGELFSSDLLRPVSPHYALFCSFLSSSG